eukprot:gene14925-biopygen20150
MWCGKCSRYTGIPSRTPPPPSRNPLVFGAERRGNVAVSMEPCTNTSFSRTSPFSDRRHRGRSGGSGSECRCGGYTVPGLKEQVRGKLSGWAGKGFYSPDFQPWELDLGIYRAFALGGVEWSA